MCAIGTTPENATSRPRRVKKRRMLIYVQTHHRIDKQGYKIRRVSCASERRGSRGRNRERLRFDYFRLSSISPSRWHSARVPSASASRLTREYSNWLEARVMPYLLSFSENSRILRSRGADQASRGYTPRRKGQREPPRLRANGGHIRKDVFLSKTEKTTTGIEVRRMQPCGCRNN